MTSLNRAEFIVEGGPNSGKAIALGDGTTTLGRQPDNDVVVDEPAVSPHHAEIDAELSYYLSDLSSNGIYVNDEKLSSGFHELDDGDRFSLGPSDVTLTYRGGDQPVLAVEGGLDSGKTIPLGGGTTTLGRQADRDVVVDSPGVSLQHAEISVDVAYYLTDVSTTGIRVNGEHLSEGVHLLTDGDRISLGSSEVTFLFRSGAAGTLVVKLPQIIR